MTVQYDGMATVTYGDAPYPSAVESAARWAALDGCATTPESDANRDYSPDAVGAETTVSRYGGCVAGGAAELWTLMGEGHLPNVNDAWRHDVLDFLLK